MRHISSAHALGTRGWSAAFPLFVSQLMGRFFCHLMEDRCQIAGHTLTTEDNEDEQLCNTETRIDAVQLDVSVVKRLRFDGNSILSSSL